MARRTVNLPDRVDALVRDLASEGESFSAAVTRLIEAGARTQAEPRPPRYVAAAGDAAAPIDLGLRAEEYLRELTTSR